MPVAPYSHIYIEREALGYPDSDRILRRFAHAQRIVIERYGELFHRPRQHFQHQKSDPKLILACAHGNLILRSDERIESFGEGHIYYNAPLRNCVYNCEYCFLQGMHLSGNLVLFVNHDDFTAAAAQFAERHGPYYLSISYLTDLLAFENIVPFCRRWIEFARTHPDITIEIRTKSDNFRAIADLPPLPNVILVWSVTPHPLAQRYEKGTASFRNRLFAIGAALRAGWRVRLCFDPVLLTADWSTQYRDCVRETARRIPMHHVEKISVGVFSHAPRFPRPNPAYA